MAASARRATRDQPSISGSTAPAPSATAAATTAARTSSGSGREGNRAIPAAMPA